METLKKFYTYYDDPSSTKQMETFYKSFSYLMPMVIDLQEIGDDYVTSSDSKFFGSVIQNMLKRSYNVDVSNQMGLFKDLTGNEAAAFIDNMIDQGSEKYGFGKFDYSDIIDYYKTVGKMPPIEDATERSYSLMEYLDKKHKDLVGDGGILLNADAKLDTIFDNLEIKGKFGKKYVGTLRDDILEDYFDASNVLKNPLKVISDPGYAAYISDKKEGVVYKKSKKTPVAMAKRIGLSYGDVVSPDDIYQPGIEALSELNVKTQELNNYNNYIPSKTQLSKLIKSIDKQVQEGLVEEDKMILVKDMLPEYIQDMDKARESLDIIQNTKKLLDLQVNIVKGE